MKYWLILLLYYAHSAQAEQRWQTSQQGCSIELKLSEVEIQQLQPLHLQATFRYPESYQLDEAALIDQLLWRANPLEPQWIITEKTLKSEKKSDQHQALSITLYPASQGTLFISLLNVKFTTASDALPSINIATPVFEIKVVDSSLKTEENLAPLLALEPQFPLYLSSKNRQLQFEDPSKLAAEEKRNLRILREHAIPWNFLLALLGIGLAGIAAIKFREYSLSKHVEETQILSLKQRAKQSLEHLKAGKDRESLSWRDLYLNLSNLCQEYLSERFKKKASFFSTAEIKPLCNSLGTLEPGLQSELISFLTSVYYVKFANDQPTREECEKAIKLIDNLIEI